MRISWLSLSLFALAGCGSSGGSDPLLLGFGGHGGSGGAAGGGQAAGGAGAQGGSGPGGAGASDPGTCPSSGLHLTGQLEGTPLDLDYRAGIGLGDSTGPAFFAYKPACGLLIFPVDTASGGSVTSTALFRLPDTSAGAGGWFCSKKASVKISSMALQSSLSLASLSALGACTGSPVSGSITGCHGGFDTCKDKGANLTSTLDGAAFSLPESGISGGFELGANGGTAYSFVEGSWGDNDQEGTAFVVFLGLENSAGELSSTVLGGALLLGAHSPDPGAAYCVGGGQYFTGHPGDAHTFTLNNLRRLGRCDDMPIAGDLTGVE